MKNLDKGTILLVVSVLCTGAATVAAFFANRAETARTADILPDYSNIEKIVVEKES